MYSQMHHTDKVHYVIFFSDKRNARQNKLTNYMLWQNWHTRFNWHNWHKNTRLSNKNGVCKEM